MLCDYQSVCCAVWRAALAHRISAWRYSRHILLKKYVYAYGAEPGYIAPFTSASLSANNDDDEYETLFAIALFSDILIPLAAPRLER